MIASVCGTALSCTDCPFNDSTPPVVTLTTVITVQMRSSSLGLGMSQLVREISIDTFDGRGIFTSVTITAYYVSPGFYCRPTLAAVDIKSYRVIAMPARSRDSLDDLFSGVLHQDFVGSSDPSTWTMPPFVEDHVPAGV